uniref:programmed cell death protein 5-like n=1 Tax=Myxine glutinosa TaxID=7769 RepID=UPI00358F2849
MEDPELDSLRRRRMAELQAQRGAENTNPQAQQAAQEATDKEAEMRNGILAQVLDQNARARLSNLGMVKPDKVKAVENYLIQMARFGQLSGQVNEEDLIGILQKVSQDGEKKTTIKFQRRRLDSDEDDF